MHKKQKDVAYYANESYNYSKYQKENYAVVFMGRFKYNRNSL